jgi:hypothetical protein
MKLADIPERYRVLYRRAMTGQSHKAAIRCHCLMCVGWEWSEVKRCSAPGCPLLPYHTGHIKRVFSGSESPERAQDDFPVGSAA